MRYAQPRDVFWRLIWTLGFLVRAIWQKQSNHWPQITSPIASLVILIEGPIQHHWLDNRIAKAKKKDRLMDTLRHFAAIGFCTLIVSLMLSYSPASAQKFELTPHDRRAIQPDNLKRVYRYFTHVYELARRCRYTFVTDKDIRVLEFAKSATRKGLALSAGMTEAELRNADATMQKVERSCNANAEEQVRDLFENLRVEHKQLYDCDVISAKCVEP